MSVSRYLLSLTFLSVLFSCTGVSCPDQENFESRKEPLARVIEQRAGQLANIKWTPLAKMPSQNGFFNAGDTRKGVPYSSVKELEKFVGTYVSFYTFMTAVSNPKSVLYTENVRNAPYHGKNCSTYYGTVCSMSVNYVLGLPYSYSTSHYKQLDDFFLVNPQEVNAIEVGDILLQEGVHVIIVADLVREDDEVTSLKILESAGTGTFFRYYSKKELQKRWVAEGLELLRYKNLFSLLDNSEKTFNAYPYDTPFNSPLCFSLGDRATYRDSEDLVLNNLDGKHHTVTVKRDCVPIDTLQVDAENYVVGNLPPGIYSFELVGEAVSSPSAEILETRVSAICDGDTVSVSFASSNGVPRSILITNIAGAHKLVTPLSDEDRAMGYKSVPRPASGEKIFVKVMFEGEYGYTFNEPVAIQ